MRYKSGISRAQDSFLPSCLDDYVGEEHLCRVISAFTETLDMTELGFKYSDTKEVGCKPFDPRMMLNLYIYGYLNRIRSSRRLHAETIRNVEVMWLLEKMAPDDKTIANFRKDNAAAIRKVFRIFTLMLKEMDLFGGELIAVDGTKIRANNSLHNNFMPHTYEAALSRIDKRIDEYMKALEETDAAETNETSPDKEKLRAAVAKLKERKKKIESVSSRVNEPGGVSIVDPDAHIMKQSGDSFVIGVCYNAQTAVDPKNNLIVDFDVSDNHTDLGTLKKMSDKVRDVLSVDKITALADKGYYDGKDIAACEKDGITCLVAKPMRQNNSRYLDPNFSFTHFTYDKERNCYICPMNQELKFKGISKSNGLMCGRYNNPAACRNCPVKAKCVPADYKTLLRSPHQNILDTVDARTKNNPAFYHKRKEMIEHPFGTIKRIWGFIQFLCRTKPKVEAEMSLTYLSYNLRRVINIFKEQNRNLIKEIKA